MHVAAASLVVSGESNRLSGMRLLCNPSILDLFGRIDGLSFGKSNSNKFTSDASASSLDYLIRECCNQVDII